MNRVFHDYDVTWIIVLIRVGSTCMVNTTLSKKKFIQKHLLPTITVAERHGRCSRKILTSSVYLPLSTPVFGVKTFLADARYVPFSGTMKSKLSLLQVFWQGQHLGLVALKQPSSWLCIWVCFQFLHLEVTFEGIKELADVIIASEYSCCI